MKVLHALLGGLAGACAVTVIHQVIKSKDQEAPRMDLLGMESLIKLLDKVGVQPPQGNKLYYTTMAGDIVSNALYYSLAGAGKNKTWLKGTLLGLAGGLGAVYLPKPLGLNEKHSNKTRKTQLLSVLYYFTGGIVSAATVKLLEISKERAAQSNLKKLKNKLGTVL